MTDNSLVGYLITPNVHNISCCHEIHRKFMISLHAYLLKLSKKIYNYDHEETIFTFWIFEITVIMKKISGHQGVVG